MTEASPAKTSPPICAPPQRDVRKPALVLPAKAADCHAHVFGPVDRYPYAPNRLYTPPPVFLDDYLAMHRAVGFERGVLVQTGLYGNDNSFIVDAIAAHPGRRAGEQSGRPARPLYDARAGHSPQAGLVGARLRGIALIGESVTDAELRHLAASGIRGFRVNRTAKTGLSIEVARTLAERVKELGWHVQFLLDVEDHPD